MAAPPPHRTLKRQTRVSRVLGFMYNRLQPSATPHSPWPTLAGGPASTTVLGVIESPLLAGVAQAVGNPLPKNTTKQKKRRGKKVRIRTEIITSELIWSFELLMV